MKSSSVRPITIPVEILALKNAKLPEKLLLAMYAADPKAARLRRALNMTGAGLRKLEDRLIQKKRLTVDGARHMVHIPGLACIGQPDDGHFISDPCATKNEKKVARRVPKTTHTTITPLLVPAELLDIKHLLTSEKLVLACYVSNPSITNECLLATLGLSLSGLKKLKQGLRQKNVLVPSDNGHVVRLPGLVLVRDSEGGHFISESDAAQSGHKVALPAPKLTPAAEIYAEWLRYIKYLRGMRDTQFGELQSYTSKMIRRVENESPDSPEREVALTRMKQKENLYFALQFVYENIPRKHEANYMKLVVNGTPEQLAAFRERVEGMTLAGMPEPKQLGLVTEAIGGVWRK